MDIALTCVPIAVGHINNMARVPNIKRLKKEDFDSKYGDLVDKLSYSLNSFMDDTINILNGNLEVSNLTQEIKTITVQMSSDADKLNKPTGQLEIVTNLKNRNVRGIICIAASRQKEAGYPDSQPFLSFSQKSQSSIIVNTITGLQAGSTYQLTLLLIS